MKDINKSKDNSEVKYTYLNPYKHFKNKESGNSEKEDKKLKVSEYFFDNLEIDSVYIHNKKFKVNSHKDRPLYKVINQKESKKYVIRKLRGKQILKGNQICFDTITANELGIKNNDALSLEKASFLDKNYKYFKQHPNEDIRFAYNCFLVGVGIGILSVVLGIMALFGIEL